MERSRYSITGSVPKEYIPGVEKGLKEAIIKGPLAGCRAPRQDIWLFSLPSKENVAHILSFSQFSLKTFRHSLINSLVPTDFWDSNTFCFRKNTTCLIKMDSFCNSMPNSLLSEIASLALTPRLSSACRLRPI